MKCEYVSWGGKGQKQFYSLSHGVAEFPNGSEHETRSKFGGSQNQSFTIGRKQDESSLVGETVTERKRRPPQKDIAPSDKIQRLWDEVADQPRLLPSIFSQAFVVVNTSDSLKSTKGNGLIDMWAGSGTRHLPGTEAGPFLSKATGFPMSQCLCTIRILLPVYTTTHPFCPLRALV